MQLDLIVDFPSEHFVRKRKRTCPPWGLRRRRRNPAISSPTMAITRATLLKGLDDGPWKTRIYEPRPSQGDSRWHGDDEARAAVYGDRNWLKSGVSKTTVAGKAQ